MKVWKYFPHIHKIFKIIYRVGNYKRVSIWSNVLFNKTRQSSTLIAS